MINKKSLELGKKPSAIRELFEYGKKRKQEIGEENVFDFSLGNPSVGSPSIVKDTLLDLINNTDPAKLHGYTSAVGDYNVRCSIADYLSKEYNANINPNLIYITVGAAASLTSSLNAIIESENDEVIVFAPYFPEYRVFIEKAKGKVVEVKPDLKTFYPDLNDLQNKININTKAIIINSPNNPTGVVIPESYLKLITDILKNKQQEYQKDIYLISDEPYRELIYSDIKYPFVSNYYDNTLICYSFSKSLSLAGERIGYIIVSNTCNNKEDVFYAICGAARSLGYVCAPSLFQYMIPNCLGYTSDLEVYKNNRNTLYNELTKYGYEVIKPDGAFYLFMKALEGDAKAFAENAKKFELLLVASDSFGYPGYVRISYCVSPSQINNSLNSFKNLFEYYQNERGNSHE